MADVTTAIVLYIDDNSRDRFLTRLVLEKAGYKVLTAANAAEAFHSVRSEPINLVLADQTLGGITGTEIAKEIKRANPRILVALFSGIIEPPKGSEQYIDMFISKDGGPEHLLERVSSLMHGVR